MVFKQKGQGQLPWPSGLKCAYRPLGVRGPQRLDEIEGLI